MRFTTNRKEIKTNLAEKSFELLELGIYNV